ncbi:hypothetical protein FACS189413_11210 [Bacteroidia bacterium]|nr:hypothetical protein FACS189463_2650 [Bacteroidia bacterium]GHU70619.1 hypothetical protein FACS189413_11210 [Bacteroidia bacterium]
MVKENTTRFKSKKFAIRIINLYKFLTEQKHEYVLSKQLLRCGTSIGANLSEADYGISKKDFLSKVYIALKECSETVYWLELLFETKYINEEEFDSINKDALELLKMLTATTKTISQEINSNH